MKRILYIEDDPDQLQLVRRMLEHELPGVIVEVCCTASGAEQFLNTNCYDVIICDVNLPGTLGTDIAERILERDPDQPIYLMSEYTGPTVRESAARIGLELHRKFSGREPKSFVDDIRQELERRPCDSSTGKFTAGRGEVAATRDNCSDVINGRTTAEISPLKKIRLISPHVLAARMMLA